MTTRGGAPALFEECRIVRAHGELDRQTVAPPARALAEARAVRPGRLLLIMDLSEATFTDSLEEQFDDALRLNREIRRKLDEHGADT
ncbi:hypothetical protein ACWEO4_33310 [Streptomyces sp. NPDC004393]|uniref:hypothetical protein n=1 Tax=Streptomyces sp. NPDC004533 TaxID=3154278 RepID=UPI0033AD44D5